MYKIINRENIVLIQTAFHIMINMYLHVNTNSKTFWFYSIHNGKSIKSYLCMYVWTNVSTLLFDKNLIMKFLPAYLLYSIICCFLLLCI